MTLSRTARTRGTALAATVGLLLSIPMAAHAEDGTIDSVIYWGLDYGRANTNSDDIGAFFGLTTALNGDMGASGWTLSFNLGVSRSEDIGAQTDGLYGSALLGYQWQMPGYYTTLAGGVHLVNTDETPGGGPTDGSEVGAIVQYGIGSTSYDKLYFQSYGSFSTVDDQVYVHAKLGYNTGSVLVGPEVTYFDDDTGGSTRRYGVFLSGISVSERIDMTVSVGVEDVSSGGGADGHYATIGFVMPLSLR